MNFLLEGRGINTEVKLLTKCLIKFLNNFFSFYNSSKTQYKFQNILSELDLFIENDTIEINIINSDSKGTANLTKSYYENNKLYNPLIILNIYPTKQEIQNKKLDLSKIRETMNHELTHCLEVYYRKKNNIISKIDWKKETELNKLIKSYKDSKIIEDLLYIYYITLSHEMNSKISQIYEYLKKSKFNTYKQLYQELKKHNLYNTIQFGINMTGEKWLSVMEQHYNKEDIVKFLKELENITSSEFIKMYTKIKERLIEFNNKLDKLVTKVRDEKMFENVSYISTTYEHFIDSTIYNI